MAKVDTADADSVLAQVLEATSSNAQDNSAAEQRDCNVAMPGDNSGLPVNTDHERKDNNDERDPLDCSSSAADTASQDTRIEISNVTPNLSETEIRGVFEAAGVIEEIVLIPECAVQTQRSWLMRFADSEMAGLALYLTGQELDGRAVDIKRISADSWTERVKLLNSSANYTSDASSSSVSAAAAANGPINSGLPSSSMVKCITPSLRNLLVDWQVPSTKTPMSVVITVPVLITPVTISEWFSEYDPISVQRVNPDGSTVQFADSLAHMTPAVSGTFGVQCGSVLSALKALRMNGNTCVIPGSGKKIFISVHFQGSRPPLIKMPSEKNQGLTEATCLASGTGLNSTIRGPNSVSVTPGLVNERSLLATMKAQLELKYGRKNHSKNGEDGTHSSKDHTNCAASLNTHNDADLATRSESGGSSVPASGQGTSSNVNSEGKRGEESMDSEESKSNGSEDRRKKKKRYRMIRYTEDVELEERRKERESAARSRDDGSPSSSEKRRLSVSDRRNDREAAEEQDDHHHHHRSSRGHSSRSHSRRRSKHADRYAGRRRENSRDRHYYRERSERSRRDRPRGRRDYSRSRSRSWDGNGGHPRRGHGRRRGGGRGPAHPPEKKKIWNGFAWVAVE